MVGIYSQMLRGVSRHYPLYSGCGSLANSRVFPRLSSAENGAQKVIESRLRCGSELLHPADDFVGRSVHFFGDLDPKLTWLFKQVLRPGDTVVDIGANLGLMSLYARDMVGATGRVVAFEPQPRLATLMQSSLERNGFENVEVHEAALGEENTEMMLSVPSVNRGSASLVRELDDVGEAFEVSVRCASELFTEVGIQGCRLVKLDVEGFEATVIAGALEHWKLHTPDVIAFEFNAGEDFSDSMIYQQLSSLQYDFFAMPKRLFRPALEAIAVNHVGPLVGHDVVAVRRGVAI